MMESQASGKSRGKGRFMSLRALEVKRQPGPARRESLVRGGSPSQEASAASAGWGGGALTAALAALAFPGSHARLFCTTTSNTVCARCENSTYTQLWNWVPECLSCGSRCGAGERARVGWVPGAVSTRQSLRSAGTALPCAWGGVGAGGTVPGRAGRPGGGDERARSLGGALGRAGQGCGRRA